MRIDLHTHSAVSDGTDTPAELVRKAAEAGLDVVALTDHDTGDGLAEARVAADRHGVELFPGLELSARHHGISIHVLVYGADLAEPEFASVLEKIRAGRSGRLDPVLAKLAELGMEISSAQVMEQVGQSPSVGRPHIADALVAAGYVRDRKEAFDRFLGDGGPAHVARYAIEVTDALAVIGQAGGVAVIAHPWGRQTRQVFTAEFLATLTTEHGLIGIEVDHQDHDQSSRDELRRLADQLGLLATGSSDYHGTGKVNHDLGCNLTRPEVFAELKSRLR